MTRIARIADWILKLPLVWGGVSCLGYYALLTNGIINSPRLLQYTFGSKIEIAEMAVFFIGAAVIVIRLLQLTPQFGALNRQLIEVAPEHGQRVEDCGRLLEQLGRLPQRLRHTYIARRLSNAVTFVQRKGTADAVEPHLRHLEELDFVQIQSSYSLLRVIIWVTPILGFLGTVVGITIAVANLDPQAVAGLDPQTLEVSMSKVTDGLGGAFDSTATALVLTTILMFAMTGVKHVEDRLLARVDDRASAELIGRFKESAVENDPNVAVVRRMSEQVIEACEALAARQAEAWRSAIDATHQQWADVTVATGTIVRDSLSSSIKENLDLHARLLNDGVQKHADRLSTSAALHGDKLDRSAQENVQRLREGLERLADLLVEALHRHGEVLTASEKELAEENRRHLTQVENALSDSMVVAADRQEQLIGRSESLLKEMQLALVEAAGTTVRQQEQLVKQSDVLLRVVDATGQIRKLEEALNGNLSALQRGYNFEEITESLTAAIGLLNTRLRHIPANTRIVELSGNDSTNQAA
ncbi:MAG: MotA/TolQ/ExbB proton channel family protein [Pirellulales bacterium]